jgi:uncharacterized membrane protein YcaP (DUF421 family)
VDIVIRASVAFFFILLVTRVIGRRELGTLEPFDLILLVVLGDLIQQGVTQSDYSVIGLMIAGATIAVLTVAVSYASFRLPALRPILDGEPIIVVNAGVVVERNLRRQRITQGELEAAARQVQVASLEDVQWGVLETDGRITFIKKSQ